MGIIPRHVIVFGCGPTPHSDNLPVMAPGARTWQIVHTVAHALGKECAQSSAPPPRITVYGLESEARQDGHYTIEKYDCIIEYLPVTIDDIRVIEQNKKPTGEAGDCVVGCASVQPCTSAAFYAEANRLPLWVDVFGDPLAEIQSKFELDQLSVDANNNQHFHVWRLFLTALRQGDFFSGLSERQRYSLLGQLGCVGRLNRHTAQKDMVCTIPYGIIPEECPCAIHPDEAPSSTTIMWCGSFNTWMDENTFTQGFMAALKKEPRLKLMIVGGEIPHYNDISYQSSLAAFSDAITAERIISYDWQPLNNTRKLYSLCNAGLNVDRRTAEAVLGSRTRIVNFMASGLPVISTIITELTEILRERQLIIPFEAENPNSLCQALVETARRNDLPTLGEKCREFVFEHFDTITLGKPLANWINHPVFAPDKFVEHESNDNALLSFWKERFLS